MKPYQYAIVNLCGKKIVVEKAYKARRNSSNSRSHHSHSNSASRLLKTLPKHGTSSRITKQMNPAQKVESTESSKIIANVNPGKEAPLEADYEEVMRRLMTVSRDGLAKRSDFVKVTFVDGSKPISRVNMKDNRTFLHELSSSRNAASNPADTYNYVICGHK